MAYFGGPALEQYLTAFHLFAVAEFDALHYAVFLFAMARHGKLQTNLEYWLARIVLALFELLPLALAIGLGQLFGRLGRGFGKLRRTGQRNLALAFPEADAERRQRLLRGCFENLGRSLGVFSHFRRESPDQWRKFIECEGLDNLQAARAGGRGVILFTGHIGSWELTSFSLSVFDRPLKFLVRRIENPKVEALVDRFRTWRGNRTIDKMYAAREMLQTLQSGGTLGILVDLNTLDREAVFVDFFGVKAATTFLVAKLALRTGAAVLPVFAPWDDERKKFRVQVGEPLMFERTADESENIIRLTQTMTTKVEDCVRHYPDQWLWIHRRWKTRPPGEPEIY
ncbi:MAG TPA: lysophospholipid acyltransferase family protein [Pyrinomonadaceae bacterium]|nr:lysophospholipid acyltransferase family protein [Pyrinomonadaceae bacterium]